MLYYTFFSLNEDYSSVVASYQPGAVDPVLLLQGINRVLLENLLPAHVATHFLSILKGRPSEELYSQKVNGSLKVQRQEMLYGYTSTRVSYP